MSRTAYVRIFVLIASAGFVSSCQREELLLSVPDTVAPLPPAGVVIESAHDGFAFVGWLKNTEHDLDGYVVLRSVSPEGPFSVLDTTARHYFIDPTCEYDTAYYYAVHALDRSGNLSERSSVVRAVSQNVNDPDAPPLLTAAGINDGLAPRVRLVWQPSPDYDVASFRIYRSSNPALINDASSLLDSTTSSIYDDMMPTVGVRYFYAVVAVDRGWRTSGQTEIATDLVTAVPELISPTDRAVLAEYPNFEWRAVSNAVEYEITVSESVFGAPIWTSRIPAGNGAIESARYSGPVLYQGQAYYWRIATISHVGGAPNAVSVSRVFQLV